MSRKSLLNCAFGLLLACCADESSRALRSPSAGPDSASLDATSSADSSRLQDAGSGQEEPHRGCPRGMFSDHNGCYTLPRGDREAACAPEARRSVSNGLFFEDLDTSAPFQPIVGRRNTAWRHLEVTGVVTELGAGLLRLDPVDDQPGVSLNPGMAQDERLPAALGDTLRLEYLEYRKDILDRRGEAVLRQQSARFLMIFDDVDRLLYAVGDPFVPARAVEVTLQALGFPVDPAPSNSCAFTEVTSEPTPVGRCYIYRQNASYRFGANAIYQATVLPGEADSFGVGRSAYRVENGNSYRVLSSDDDCDVMAESDFRIVRLD